MSGCERCGSGGGPQPCVEDGLCCLCRKNLGLPERQILGSGKDDFGQCADCAWDICWQAKACLRQRTQT